MSQPSEKAIEAANAIGSFSFDHLPPSKYLEVAHDPALGLERSVCLRDVVEALSGHPADHTFDAREIILLRFGGERAGRTAS